MDDTTISLLSILVLYILSSTCALRRCCLRPCTHLACLKMVLHTLQADGFQGIDPQPNVDHRDVDSQSKNKRKRVAALTSGQLARKRQQDRDSQRVIRRKTKEYVADLERRIQDKSTALEEAIIRNKQLQ